MTVIEMRKKLYSVASRYLPVKPYLQENNLREMADDFVTIYETFLSGGSVKDISLELCVMPEAEEALEFEQTLKTAADFVSEFEEVMLLNEQAGAAMKNSNKLRLVSTATT